MYLGNREVGVFEKEKILPERRQYSNDTRMKKKTRSLVHW
jgi:hypothetical protein